jgi:pheromone a factor receptor
MFSAVTKILIGSNVALPAACLCLLRNLDEISSNREPTPNILAKRDHRMFDATMCILLPIVYVCLRECLNSFKMTCQSNITADFFVQDRRFDIIQDFGCQAAIYPSTLAIILMWLLPLFICVTALVFFGTLSASFSIETKHSQRIIQQESPCSTFTATVQIFLSTWPREKKS